jgi:hypothetical protein
MWQMRVHTRNKCLSLPATKAGCPIQAVLWLEWGTHHLLPVERQNQSVGTSFTICRVCLVADEAAVLALVLRWPPKRDPAKQSERHKEAAIDAEDGTIPLLPQSPACTLRIPLNGCGIGEAPDHTAPGRDSAICSGYPHRIPSLCCSHWHDPDFINLAESSMRSSERAFPNRDTTVPAAQPTMLPISS